MAVAAIVAPVAMLLRSRQVRPPDGGAGAAVTPNEVPRSATAAPVEVPPTTSEQPDFEVPAPTGLDAVLQGGWTHPLAGPFRDLPSHELRRFGAYRSRETYRDRYCGQGHCGIDLGYNIGLPVLAARDGTVERVVRDPTEFEGRYVKLRHAGGLRTYYMHLDQVAPELELGMAVRAGQMIATLGRTGLKLAQPHLHFMISFEVNGKERFVDPEPLVARGDLVEVDPLPAWAKPR